MALACDAPYARLVRSTRDDRGRFSSEIELRTHWATLIVRIVTGAVLYALLLLALDAEARRDGGKVLAKVKAKLGRA